MNMEIEAEVPPRQQTEETIGTHNCANYELTLAEVEEGEDMIITNTENDMEIDPPRIREEDQ